MLETINLQKIYKTKKGIKVEALKGVSLKFPETGMVFLLGKSGSGKSTLLNLLGGLDQYDNGEIIIKGVSSKDFHQSQFDSYRNTYVGFIFQEYNVLEEFTVGANIALAIELQGRRATDDEISRILREVDLEGFGDRKPNELSGGQKQRVAIARALVKNPQIIMADEPTGALDSNTGKQVLETLKKLAKDKLVIVVSHDREFAESYGDRIIELADGQVINDVERVKDDPNVDKINDSKIENLQNPEGIVFGNDEIVFSAGYHLTEEDRILINDYLSGKKAKVKALVRKKRTGGFEQTDQDKIVHTDHVFELIRSKLPMKNAIKMGASALKYKKFRLVMTILLSLVAFSLFALADTFGSYDNTKTCTQSLIDSEVNYASFTKSIIVEADWGSFKSQAFISDDDIRKINQETGMDFDGVYVPSIDFWNANYDTTVQLTENEDEETSYATYFSGFMTMTKEKAEQYGYDIVAGKLPEGNQKQTAITTYSFETFKKAGYKATGSDKVEKISDYKDMVGKFIHVGADEYEITGVVDVHMNFDRYSVINEYQNNASTAQTLAVYALENELYNIKGYSTAGALMISDETMQSLLDKRINSIYLGSCDINITNDQISVYASKVAKISDIDLSKVIWINEEHTALKSREIILPLSSIYDYDTDKSFSKEEAIEILKKRSKVDYLYSNYIDDSSETQEVHVAGIIDDTEMSEDYMDLLILSDDLFKPEWNKLIGTYEYIVAPMPAKKADVEQIVEFNQKKNEEKDLGMIQYQLKNSVIYELDAIDEGLKILSDVFLYIGIGFAIFAGLMLANFIATSISYKRQEIGILRAIGARSSDVFRIFFSESFMIAIVNFVLSCIGAGIATSLINGLLRMEVGILVTILNFGIRQILLLLLLSIVIAWVASFLPVYKIARKRPIDAIRNK